MIYDVTVPITNSMPVWPSDPPVQLTPQSHKSRDNSHTVRLTKIEMGSHTGTHIDAPWHFVPNGRRLSEIPVDTMVGPATVFTVHGVRSISSNADEQMSLKGVERVLCKTDNSKHWSDGSCDEDFVWLEP